MTTETTAALADTSLRRTKISLTREQLPYLTLLTRDQLNALSAVVVRHMTYEQAAEEFVTPKILGDTPSDGTIKSRVNRARTRLRQLVKDEAEIPDMDTIWSWTGHAPDTDSRSGALATLAAIAHSDEFVAENKSFVDQVLLELVTATSKHRAKAE